VEIHATEEQQVEAIKNWWKENRWSVIGGIALGIVVLFGGRAWVEGQNSYIESAFSEYQNMLNDISEGKSEDAEKKGANLLGQYSDTPYAPLAALALANIKLEKGDLVAASSHLRWALDNAKQESVKHETRLRLGKLLLAENKTSDALNLLNVTDTGMYTPAYEHLKGDIYVKEGKLESARTAYSRALMELSPASPDRKILQMKLDDLGKNAEEGIS
jgi:predicted negative regulator of RcsB-dependent stress response